MQTERPPLYSQSHSSSQIFSIYLNNVSLGPLKKDVECNVSPEMLVLVVQYMERYILIMLL